MQCAVQPLKKGTYLCFNGHVRMASLGMKSLAVEQPEEDIYQFFNGHVRMAVLGM
jgi:hypothetical protein